MASKAWTEGEKLGLLFQIIAKSGPIPWADLTLPEGRTKKACDVMIFKEKEKVKKARELATAGEGENDDLTTATPNGKGSATKKRGGVTEDGEEGESPTKKAKAKTPRKKKSEKTAVVAAADVEEDDEEGVKAEVDD